MTDADLAAAKQMRQDHLPLTAIRAEMRCSWGYLYGLFDELKRRDGTYAIGRYYRPKALTAEHCERISAGMKARVA